MIAKTNVNNYSVFLCFLSGGKSIGRYFESIESLGLDSTFAYAHQLNNRFYAKSFKVSSKYMYLSIKKVFKENDVVKIGDIEAYLNGEPILGGVGVFDEFAHSITLYNVNSQECIEYHFNDALWNEMLVIQDNQ